MGNAVNFLKTVWVKAHGGSNPSSCANGEVEFVFYFSHTQVLKKDSRDANIGVGITTYLYRSLLGLPLKFNTVSTVWKFECL